MNKELKLGIIGGVLASVIVIIFIQPILSFVWRGMISVGGILHHGFVDRIYKNAALGDRNLSAGIVIILVLTGLILTLKPQFINSKNNNPVITRRLHKFTNVMCIVVAYVAIVFSFFGFALSMGISEIRASFNQRLEVLAPAITDGEYKTYRARWALMKDLDDYNSIVAAMDKRAKELNVDLPAVREP